MTRTFDRLKYIFLGLFLAGCVGVFAYHYLWVWPKDRCEASGGWWAGRWMKCATPMPLSVLTGRVKGVPPINTGYKGSTKPPPAAK